MEKSIRKGIKNLNLIKKKAKRYSKGIYNDFARPLVRNFRKKIARVYLREAYKNGMIALRKAANEGEKFIDYAGRIYKINERRLVRSALYKDAVKSFSKARKFAINKYPKAKRTITNFVYVRYVKAEKFVNRSYPKIEKFVNRQYPVVKKWVVTQLPKVQAFLAGQLSARVQRIAA